MFPFHIVYSAGPIDAPSLDTFVELVNSIDSGQIYGDEVTLEPLAAWRRVAKSWFRPAPGDQCGFSLLRFWPDERAPTWLAHYWDASRTEWFASGSGLERYCGGILCGAPATVSESCFLRLETGIELAREFCQLMGRPRSCTWNPMSVALNM